MRSHDGEPPLSVNSGGGPFTCGPAA